MMTELLPFLIVCPLVFLAGFIDAIAGGGGLISIPAYIIAGLPPHVALGTNKFSSSMGTTMATFQYARRGYVHGPQAIVSIATALAGSYIGSQLAMLVPDNTFKVVMLVILPLIALYVTFRKKLTSDKPAYPLGKTLLLIGALGFGIGMYDGFYGPGTGTFLMLALTGIAHVTLNDAAGITKTTNLASNLAALYVFWMNDVVWLQLGLVAALFSIAGNFLGARFFTQRGTAIVRPTIFVVLAIFFLKVCWDLWM